MGDRRPFSNVDPYPSTYTASNSRRLWSQYRQPWATHLITNVFRCRRCTSEQTLTSVATQSGEQQHRGPAADVVPLPCLLAWAVPVCPLSTVGKYWQTPPQNSGKPSIKTFIKSPRLVYLSTRPTSWCLFAHKRHWSHCRMQTGRGNANVSAWQVNKRNVVPLTCVAFTDSRWEMDRRPMFV
jgi:hypothetical protein